MRTTPMTRTELQAAFVVALSPRPKVSLRKPVSLRKRSS